MRCLIEAEAQAELAEAMQWYDRQTPRVGARLWLEFEGLARRLAATPEAYPPYGERGVRKARLRNFPYAVYYRAAGEELRILGVTHHARKPEFARKRCGL